jgi:hypothetical protein
VPRIRAGAARPWTIVDADTKLAWRAQLPGASGFDGAAHVLRGLQARGADALDLLPLALPASWMVNSSATARAFRRWMGSEGRGAWEELLRIVDFTLSFEGWLSLDDPARATAERLVAALAPDAEGASLTAVSKVLALLRPQVVPLMDEAAVSFALDLSAAPRAFVPMMDWFARAALAAADALVAVAARHDHAVLDAAQVLDRLVWFDSSGYALAQDLSPRVSEDRVVVLGAHQ